MRYILDSKDGNFHAFIREDDEEVKLVLHMEEVPETLKEGDVVEVTQRQGKYIFNVLEEETQKRLNRSKMLIEKLKNK